MLWIWPSPSSQHSRLTKYFLQDTVMIQKMARSRLPATFSLSAPTPPVTVLQPQKTRRSLQSLIIAKLALLYTKHHHTIRPLKWKDCWIGSHPTHFLCIEETHWNLGYSFTVNPFDNQATEFDQGNDDDGRDQPQSIKTTAASDKEVTLNTSIAKSKVEGWMEHMEAVLHYSSSRSSSSISKLQFQKTSHRW